VHPIPDSPNLQICLFKALLEDKKVFQNILKSKVYQASVKAIVIDEAHLVEEW
jgi:superfamily II DNA helicase RecQ